MGYIRHHAIVVTSQASDVTKAHEKARSIFPAVSDILPGVANAFASFFIPPDGSKETWDASNEGDARRGEFIGWLEAQCGEDGSSPHDWAEVQYGDGDLETKVTRDSDARRRGHARTQE